VAVGRLALAGAAGWRQSFRRHVRNGLLEDRHDLRVRSVAVLLHPEADSPQLTGVSERNFPGEESYLIFRYQVLRVWQLAPEPLLTGSLALLPLAAISAVTEAELPGIIQRMKQRLSGRRQAEVVWAASYILLGLRYSPALAAHLFRGVLTMKESATYQAILEEGRNEGRNEGRVEGAVAEAKKLLRLWGGKAFGPPDTRMAAAIKRLNDLPQLEKLLERVRQAASWQELLGAATAGQRRRRRPPAS